MADLDDLKAAFEQTMTAINRLDLEAFLALHHDQVVVFGGDAPFAVDGKAAVRQAFQTFFDNSESATRGCSTILEECYG